MQLGTEVVLGPGHVVMGTQLSPIAHLPYFGPYSCCDQTAGWIMMGESTRYGGRPRPTHIVLDGDPVPPRRGTLPPIFGSCLLWPNSLIDQDATWYGGRPRRRPRCVKWGPIPPKKIWLISHPFSAHLYWPNGWVDQDALWYVGRPRLTRHCVRWGPSSLLSPEKGHSHSPIFGPSAGEGLR